MGDTTELWEKICFILSDLNKIRDRVAALETMPITQQTKRKKHRRPNHAGLKLIDGGQKFEDQPPFVH